MASSRLLENMKKTKGALPLLKSLCKENWSKITLCKIFRETYPDICLNMKNMDDVLKHFQIKREESRRYEI